MELLALDVDELLKSGTNSDKERIDIPLFYNYY